MKDKEFWKALPLEKWACGYSEENDKILYGGEWPKFPNVHKYKYNTEDLTKPYCWDWGRKGTGDRFAHLMTIEAWKDSVKSGGFIDYDGYGQLLQFRDGDYYPLNYEISPSQAKKAPKEATHIDWFNR